MSHWQCFKQVARRRTLAVAAPLAWLAAGCATTPLPELPPGDVPERWAHAQGSDDRWPRPDWWNAFASDELRGLIIRLEAQNLDLKNNARNLQLAQIALREAGFDLYPRPVLDWDAAQRYAGTEPAGGDYRDGGSSAAALSAGIVYSDILSKPYRFEAARARYDLSIALAAATRLNVLGTAASTYFRILLLRDRIEAAEQNLANAEAIAKIVQARVDAGTVTPIDALQQQIAVQRQRSNIRSLMQDVLAARSALALLLAESVQSFDVAETSLERIAVPSVQPGLPASLLSRRPDILQAEANLRVSRANVDLARSAFLPDISLTSSAGLTSDSLRSLASSAGTTLTGAATVAQRLFDNGARRRALQQSRIELESALANYRETVIGAFNEIEVALGNIELLAALGKVAEEDLGRAQAAFRIAQARYREGVVDYQTVLLSQNTLYDARNARLDNKLAQLNAIVALHQSLGGGWRQASN